MFNKLLILKDLLYSLEKVAKVVFGKIDKVAPKTLEDLKELEKIVKCLVSFRADHLDEHKSIK